MLTKWLKMFWVIAVGLVWVNLPVIPVIVIPMVFGVGLMEVATKDSLFSTTLVLLSIPATGYIGFRLGWRWWALNIPKWRLWAYPMVYSVEHLKSWARAVGLIWPDGHRAEKTEIRTQEMDEQIRRWEGR